MHFISDYLLALAPDICVCSSSGVAADTASRWCHSFSWWSAPGRAWAVRTRSSDTRTERHPL